MRLKYSFKIIYFLLFLQPFIYQNSYGQNWDINITKNIQNNKLVSDQLMYYQSQSLYPVGLGIPAGGLLYGYLKSDEKVFNQAVNAVGSLSLTYIITKGTKVIVQRDRPFITYPDLIQPYYQQNGYSFFSGHSAIAFALATSLTLSYPKWYVYIPAYLYATTMAYSRLQLGVHYPSDVIIGGIVGIGSSIAAHHLMNWLRQQTYYPKINRFKKDQNLSLAIPPALF